MIKLWKIDNNGEVIVQSDDTDLDSFLNNLAGAMAQWCFDDATKGDEEHDFNWILSNAFPIALNLSGCQCMPNDVRLRLRTLMTYGSGDTDDLEPDMIYPDELRGHPTGRCLKCGKEWPAYKTDRCPLCNAVGELLQSGEPLDKVSDEEKLNGR